MKQATLLQQGRVMVASIICRDRLRPASEAGVESLIASIEETGVMKDAIHCRKKKDGKLYLIAGAHRLEAARRLGWDEIEAKVWTDVTDDWARMMEIDDNLAGAEMNALDTAVFLAARKQVYERLHPETKRGIAGALARWDATEPSSVAFVKATAAKFGMTERQVYKIAAAGSHLDQDLTDSLRRAPRPVTLKDLTEIGKIAYPVELHQVIRALTDGTAKNAAAARKAFLAAKNGAAPTVKNPAEDGFKALIALWGRVPKASKRRFAGHFAAELQELIDQAQGEGQE